MQANEAGGWVIDPSNPNRATYTDEDGEVYEAFRDVTPTAPQAAEANVLEFGDSTEAANTSIRNQAIDTASVLDQMLADTRYTDQDIRDWVKKQPGQFGRIEENLEARRRGMNIGRTTVEPFIKPDLKPVIPEGGRDFGERLSDSYNEAVQYGFPGLAARKLFDWTEQYKPEIRQKFPGQTEEWYEQMQEEMIAQAQRSIRQTYAAKQAADPSWKDDGTLADNILNNDRFLPYIAGQVFGSVGPESFVMPGATAARRIAVQAALGAGSDVGYQALEIGDNVRDEINPTEVLLSGAAGAGFQGVLEAPGALSRLARGAIPEAAPSVDPLRQIPETLDEPANPYQAEARRLYDDPSSTRKDFDDLADRMGMPRENIQLDAGLGTRNEKNAVTLFPEAGEKRVNPERSDFAVRHIDDLTKDWQNRPAYEVYETFDNMPDVDKNAIGVVTPDGRVMINMKNVDSVDTLTAVTFHEGLGHHGLSQKFGDDLDLTLDEIYQNSSGQFKKDVDDWVESNPREYAGPDQVTRATEEVLAEMSEAGRIPVSVMNRLRNTIKQYGRDLGFDFKYTDREIKTILGMAHDATINGMKNDVMGNGFRYSKAWHGSPYQFERFNNSENAGSGDGGNLFGYGTYLTESRDLASAYKPKSGGSLYEVDIPDGRWLEWEKPLNDQPQVLEAFKKAGIYEPHMGRMTAGEAYNEAGFFNGPREVSEALADQGVTGNKYVDNPGSNDPVNNFVVFKEDDAKIVNRYMKRREGSVDPENIRNIRDLDYFLGRAGEMAKEADGDLGRTVPREDTVALAESLGLTPSRVAKGKSEEGLAARIDAGMQVLVNQLGKVEKISARMVDAPPSQQGRLHLQMNKEMAVLAAVYGRVSGNNSEVGRALNILNRMRSVTGTADDVLKYMKDNGNDVLGDPENFQKFMKLFQGQGLAGQAKLIRAAFKPKAEEYIFRLWYNMMLSAPATHTTNFMGNGLNFMYDLLENTGAAVVGQGKRFGNADRVRGREVAYRMYGALNALRDAKTWQESGKSFMTGKTGGQANSKTGGSNVYQGNDTLLKGASMVLEGPTRALAAGDEWWRNVMQLSNIYGLSVRNAGNKGLKGQAFWGEVNNLINNPTPEMISATNDYTKVLQFLDKPSALGKLIIDAQTPKPNSGVLGRVARGTLRLAVPFVRTPDALIRTAIRRSAVLSPLERENVRQWKAGGAERDQVLARVAMGSALGFYVASQVQAGNITGLGPSDYKKKAEWMGSHQENSIKVGKKWYSIAGLEPVSTNITTIATLAERLRSNEISDEDYAKAIITPIHTIAASLSETSYLQGFQDLMEISSSDPRKAETALTNFLANTAASATTPAIVRSYTQSNDTAIRDTTGDGSFSDRVKGRIESATPGLSEELPQRYDVFGRPRNRDIAGPNMATRINQREEETDPVVLEVQRLGDMTKAVVLGAPSKSNIKVNGERRKLNAEEYSRYQHLSGYWITESIRQEMQGGEWDKLSDGEKFLLIKDITEDMRKEARNVLFDPDDEEE